MQISRLDSKSWKLFLRIFILTVFVGIFIKSIDFKNVLRVFSINFVYAILIAQIPLLLSNLLVASRHRFFLNRQPKISLVSSFNAVMLANGFNNLMPARISEVLKATYLRSVCGVPISIGVGAVFMERLIDVMVLAILMFISAFSMVQGVEWYYSFGLFLFAAVFIPILVRSGLAFRILRIFIRWQFLQNFIEKSIEQIRNKMTIKSLAVGFIYGIMIWFCSVTAVHLFLNVASGSAFALSASLLIMISGTIGLAIPGLPGGLGTFELAAVYVMMRMGIDVTTATAYAIGLRLSNIAVILPYSIILVFMSGTGVSGILKALSEFGRGTDS